MPRLLITLCCSAAACGPTGLPVLGGGHDDVARVDLQVIATAEDGLDAPQDLAFDPEHPGRLWVVNRGDDSVTIVFDAGTGGQTSENRVDPFAEHFMDEVSSISFGAPGTFGTCPGGEPRSGRLRTRSWPWLRRPQRRVHPGVRDRRDRPPPRRTRPPAPRCGARAPDRGRPRQRVLLV